jgi:acyl-CoA thioesterase-2
MDLGALFELAPHGPDTFVGAGPRYPWGGLFGGQIVAQALRAASSTVDVELEPHSLRAYFIRRGDHTEPIRYEVDRIRNGRSFCTRRVVARQAVGAILNLEASFQRPEPAIDLQTVVMPSGLPSPDECPDDTWTTSFARRPVPRDALPTTGTLGAGRVAAWMKVNDVVAPDELVHRCWLAYMSDDIPTDSVRRALAEREQPPVIDIDAWWQGSFAASLDHTVWFHRPLRVDEWHLYDFACHGSVGGRGVSVGHVFTADGVHAATVAQEVLIRRGRLEVAVPGGGAHPAE